MADISSQLQQSVVEAIENRISLNIVGSNSKHFLGYQAKGRSLSLSEHNGIIDYQPTELVLTARAGTKLSEIESVLAKSGQMLPFDPPHFSDQATIGGTIACGLSGSIRPFTGSARDFILGCKIINGRGEVIQFGGQVMKNVAGYDLSRLMVGAMGTLGILLEVSIKVLPAPAKTVSFSQARSADDALRLMQILSGQNLPLSGLAYDGESVHIRLSGAKTAVNAAMQRLGGKEEDASHFWTLLKEQTHPFFDGETPLWRFSVPPTTPLSHQKGKQFIDWAGALRWLKTDLAAEQLFKLAATQNGHAQLFRGGDLLTDKMPPMPDKLLKLHQRLKTSFDPHGIFNPGRLDAEI